MRPFLTPCVVFLTFCYFELFNYFLLLHMYHQLFAAFFEIEIISSIELYRMYQIPVTFNDTHTTRESPVS